MRYIGHEEFFESHLVKDSAKQKKESSTVIPIPAARSMQHELQKSWQTIHHCLSKQAPEVLHRLQPGATDEQFHQAEAILHVPLPEEVKALYRLHDGCARFITPPGGPLMEPYKCSTSGLFLDWWHFHSLEVLCEAWETLEAEGGCGMEWSAFIQQDVQEGRVPFLAHAVFYPFSWHPRWLPFMTGQGSYFIDLLPGPKGNVGQILFVPDFHEREGIAHVVAPSLSAFFRHIANELVAGSYVFDDSTGFFLSEEGWLFVHKWLQSELGRFWHERKTYTGRNTIPHPDTLTYALLKGGR